MVVVLVYLNPYGQYYLDDVGTEMDRHVVRKLRVTRTVNELRCADG